MSGQRFVNAAIWTLGVLVVVVWGLRFAEAWQEAGKPNPPRFCRKHRIYHEAGCR
jgi:hypothetical protein